MHYHFTSLESMREAVARGDFIEHAEVKKGQGLLVARTTAVQCCCKILAANAPLLSLHFVSLLHSHDVRIIILIKGAEGAATQRTWFTLYDSEGCLSLKAEKMHQDSEEHKLNCDAGFSTPYYKLRRVAVGSAQRA